MKEIIVVEGLTKRFKLSRKQMHTEKSAEKVKIAVNDLRFKAYEGEIFGLLGPNGAGKTTTLRMLSTLIKPDEGDAFIDGASVSSQASEVRAKIGFLTSEMRLEEFFSPNYLFAFFAGLHGMKGKAMKQRREALFERFGITSYGDVKVSELSSGMKQKASLAISLAHDPAIVIFDEPTNGLDVIVARTVTDYLSELKGLGKSIVLSTHIFSLVEKICDRVGIIIDGKMATYGRLAEVERGKGMEDRFFEIYRQSGGVLE